jgi:integrase
MKIGQITRTEIERLMRSIAEGRTAARLKARARGKSNFRGGKTAATRTVGLLQGMFTFAEARGLIASNPTRGVKRYADTKRERFLSGAEMAALGLALREMQDEGRNENGIDVLRLLALSGARRAEVERLRWEEVDFDRGLVRLKDSKTGAKTFPLAPAALQLLQTRKQTSSGPFVFAAARGDGSFNGTGKIWREARSRAGLEGVRIHDLRHTFASFGASSGFGLPVIGAILGHTQATTTQRYAHLANDPLQQAVARIGDEIAGHLGASKG